MVTESFDMDLIIDTDEKAERMLEALEMADAREEREHVDCLRMLEEGRKFISKGRPQ